MNTTETYVYLIIEKRERYWQKGKFKVARATPNRPELKHGQAAIMLRLILPNDLFSTITASVTVDATCIQKPQINVEAIKP